MQVPKESHEVLKWVFNQIGIPALITTQKNGQLLHVLEVGAFKVQWHIAANMKTIKCLYGLQHCVNSKHSCIYCLQERSKPVINSATRLLAAQRKTSHSWSGGLFVSCIHAKPITGAQSLSRWKPIFPIPMD